MSTLQTMCPFCDLHDHLNGQVSQLTKFLPLLTGGELNLSLLTRCVQFYVIFDKVSRLTKEFKKPFSSNKQVHLVMWVFAFYDGPKCNQNWM
jgi:hypothetical protein